jgi:hypothetical protein
MVYLADIDGDNDGSSDSGADATGKEWAIDGVCWADANGANVGSCNGADDTIIAAGLWAEDTYVEDIGSGIELVTAGNNDDGLSDWKAIPEFGTLLMPVASVLLIVGYNYRKRNNLVA